MNNHEKLSQAWVQNMLAQPLLARLATSNPITLQPHVVPVWFAWDGEAVLVSAFSSTRKVREVIQNKQISILVDTGNPGEATRGILFEGNAELIQDSDQVAVLARQIYTCYSHDGILDAAAESWLIDPENRIIRLKPEKIYTWG